MALNGGSCRDWVNGAAHWVGGFVDRHGSLGLCVVMLLLAGATGAEAAVSADMTPWGLAATQICVLLTGIVGKSLAITAVVVAGMTYAFGEGGSKSAMAALAFGAGMVLLAPAFLSFFFSVDTSCGMA